VDFNFNTLRQLVSNTNSKVGISFNYKQNTTAKDPFKQFGTWMPILDLPLTDKVKAIKRLLQVYLRHQEAEGMNHPTSLDCDAARLRASLHCIAVRMTLLADVARWCTCWPWMALGTTQFFFHTLSCPTISFLYGTCTIFLTRRHRRHRKST
jgi:hypothetical protein